ncbi:MAG: carboxypeptidase regulatory-like domain-containing protein [Bacteroidota bacterium]
MRNRLQRLCKSNTVVLATRLFFGSSFIIFALCCVMLHGSCSKPQIDEEYPSVISGQVRNTEGIPLADARISLPTAPDFDAVWTDSQGFFRLENFPAGHHRIRAERVGYQTYEANVPKPINGVSTVNLVLARALYSVPPAKPLSTGPVRIRNKLLEVDFDGDGHYEPFVVKGVAFSPMPIGSSAGVSLSPRVIDRAIQYLNGMHANTIRTYGGANKYLLQKAADSGIRVIVGFWVDYALDLSQSQIREAIKEEFGKMVLDLKGYSSILFWNIGNEQNYQNGNNPYWYTLVQELAIVAFEVEGEKYHPVCASNGGFANIGDSSMDADDNSLTYMDLWATNNYEYDFTSSFANYRRRTGKPLVVTEFGIDALDNRTHQEYEDVQAAFDSTNWLQIRAAADVCVGATVFEFTDEWWKAGDPWNHDFGGYPTGSHPDGYSNEEWWGTVAVTPDKNGDGLDEWRPRKVYYTLGRLWR